MQLRRKLNPHNPPKRKFRSHQQSSPFARPKINEYKTLELDLQACENGMKSGRLYGRVVIPMNPVGAGNLQITEIGPAFKVTIGFDAILLIEAAGRLITAINLSCLLVLSKQVDGQQCASVKADKESPLLDRLLHAGNNRPKDPWHASEGGETGAPARPAESSKTACCRQADAMDEGES